MIQKITSKYSSAIHFVRFINVSREFLMPNATTDAILIWCSIHYRQKPSKLWGEKAKEIKADLQLASYLHCLKQVQSTLKYTMHTRLISATIIINIYMGQWENKQKGSFFSFLFSFPIGGSPNIQQRDSVARMERDPG